MVEPGGGGGSSPGPRPSAQWSAQSADHRSAELGEWPITGRDEELALLRRALSVERRSIVIAGPAGVGKSRLAREAMAVASAGGAPTRYVTATRSAAATPLGALLDVLGDLREGEDQGQRFRLVGRALRGAAVGTGPTVVGIDDGHLLDDGSAALLHHLAQQGDARLVLTLRTGEPAPDAVTALWRDELAERIDLQPLDRADVGALLRATLPGADDDGTAHRLWTTTGGNPLYLRELTREALRVGDLRLVDGVWAWDARRIPVSTRLRELVAMSLLDVAADERAVLDLLAVGEPLPSTMVDHGEAGDAVAGLERHRLVVIDTSGAVPVLRLHHPMLGEVLRSTLTSSDRRRLAGRLAELATVEFATVGAVDPLRVTAWRIEAGLAAEPEHLLGAATTALHRFDPAMAERLARLAVTAGAGSGATIALGRALIAQERYVDAAAVLEPLEQASVDEAELLVVATLLGDVRFYGLGQAGDAEAGVARVAARATGEVARLHLLALRASIRNDAGETAGALALTGWATDADRDVGARLHAVSSAANALTLSGRPADALALCEELLPVAVARAGDTPRDVGRVLGQQVHALVALGRLDEAQGIIAFVHEVVAGDGDDEAQGGSALVLGQLALERGQVAEARTWLREAATVLGRFDPQRYLSWCMGLTASAAALAGDIAAAEAAAGEAERLAARWPTRSYEVRVALGRADALAATGECTGAAEVMLRTADRLEAAGNRYGAAIAIDAAVGFEARPGPLAARLARLGEGSQIVWIELWRANAAAVAAGDGSALEAAGRRFAELGSALRAAGAFEHAAHAYGQVGRRASASRAGGVAARHRAACVGARIPAATATGADRLTRREREIATLAASGLSNVAIAGRLHIGVRTVEGHLLRATTKLGVRARHELAAVLG